jgi:hypothetical protein
MSEIELPQEIEVLTVVEERPIIGAIDFGFSGAKGDTGAVGPSGDGSVLVKIAGEAMSAYRAVVSNGGADVLLANNTDSAHRRRVLGITEIAAAAAADTRIRRFGPLEFGGWAWTPDELIFVGVDGALTQTPPVPPAAFSQAIAVALSATRIYVWPRDPVALI